MAQLAKQDNQGGEGLSLPLVLVTGSSGFLGRHLLEEMKTDYRIFGLARRSPAQTGAPLHRNITWFQVDIRDRHALGRAFREIRRTGGVESVVHLAAYYDFTGEEHPDYLRTNVEGLRNVLDECRLLDLRRFIFASSVVTCDFRSRNRVIDETTPADGHFHYADSKRRGEAMLEEYTDEVPSCIIRFAALFSDWCEYPPLFKFIETWLSTSWRRRLIGGKGLMGIPYLHIRDAVRFVVRVLELQDDLRPSEILIASPDGSVTTNQLFEDSTLCYFGAPAEPLYLPREVCRAGIYLRDRCRRLLGERPFERVWMASYIDRRLDIDASNTRAKLGWEPQERLNIRRRVPFMIENLKSEPLEWYRRNHMAMRVVEASGRLRVHRLLEKHERQICDEVTALMVSSEGREHFPSYQALRIEEREWKHRVALRHLMDCVRTGDKSPYSAFCRDLAELRFAQGFAAEEVCGALQTLCDTCVQTLFDDSESRGLEQEIERHIMMTMTFGCDQAQETLNRLKERAERSNKQNRRLKPVDS